MPLSDPPSRSYPRKPLVEAICEIRWQLAASATAQPVQQGAAPLMLLGTDPHYQATVTALAARLSEYPVREQVLPDQVPLEITPNQVRQRFRAAAGQWPVLQIGPGILTTNETACYSWPSFRARTVAAFGHLNAAHPNPTALAVNSLMLRYIDVLPAECMTGDLASILNDKLRIQAQLPSDLFADSGVTRDPIGFRFQSVHATENPRGAITLTAFLGAVGGERRVLWETLVHSTGSDVPSMPEGFETWLDDAHRLSRLWFDRMTERIRESFA